MSNEQVWNWPDELDGLIAGPRYHALIFENERVRVLDTRVPPAETVPLHTHRWPGVLCVLNWSDFVRRDAEGRTVADSRGMGEMQVGSAVWSEPLPPHSLENVGESEIRAICVELKSP